MVLVTVVVPKTADTEEPKQTLGSEQQFMTFRLRLIPSVSRGRTFVDVGMTLKATEEPSRPTQTHRPCTRALDE